MNTDPMFLVRTTALVYCYAKIVEIIKSENRQGLTFFIIATLIMTLIHISLSLK
jgi:hypothetical protein